MNYTLTKYGVESKTECASLRDLPPASELVSVSRGFCHDSKGRFQFIRVTLHYRKDVYAVNLYEPEAVRDFFRWLDEIFSANKKGR